MHDEHPLVLELTSLRQTAARFQHEAHAAAVRLQRQALEAARAHEHAAALDNENARLREEVAFLRAHPEPVSHPAEGQVQELTLALRRVSEKIDLTEQALLERTGELTHARSDLEKARREVESAYELAARMRSREEEGKARERALQAQARAAEEERKMVDLVVLEYADLVRSLEGRKSVQPSAEHTTLVDDLRDKKAGLQKLFAEFTQETGILEATISDLRREVSLLQAQLDAERQTSLRDRTFLSQAQAELDRLRLDDQTSAKMVTRYIIAGYRKFSQSSTNALQSQITALKARHAATVSTLQFQLSHAELLFASERGQCARLQDALDELCEDLARETYGRRREVALRLALLAREEAITESLRRWARRARESYERCMSHRNSPDSSDVSEGHSKPASSFVVEDAFQRMVSDAESLLAALDHEMEYSDGNTTSGGLARIAVAREAVDALRDELQSEVGRRIDAVQRFASPGKTSTDSTPASDGRDQDVLLEKSEKEPLKLSTPLLDGNMLPSSDTKRNAISQGEDPPSAVVRPSKAGMNGDLLKEACPPSHDTTCEAAKENGPDAQEGPCSMPLLTNNDPVTFKQEPLPSVSNFEPPPAAPDTFERDSPLSCTVSPSKDDVDIPTNATGSMLTEAAGSSSCPLPTPASHVELSIKAQKPSSSPVLTQTSMPESALLHSLTQAKHRYDTLQRAFRDSSLALKNLKSNLESPSPSALHPTTSCPEPHLLAALMRIEDYTEDARVELEIRIADEELTARGFETVLSVTGALTDSAERAETVANAQQFADGSDEGVQRALERFNRKLEDVQHDVAVLKRAVHEMSLGDSESDGGANKDMPGWTSWTAGLLSTNSSPPRPSATLTFGSVMTSPRLRHANSLKQLRGADEHADPLAGLGFRIPMPSPVVARSLSGTSVTSTPNYGGLGLGKAPGTRPRTISTMYSLGLGARSSSVAISVGLGAVGLPRSSSSLSKSSRPSTPINPSRLTIHSPLAVQGGTSEQRPGSALISGVEDGSNIICDEKDGVTDRDQSDVE
ncbi:hypothetical protein ID866_6528 [Astraeus odoratus]|nr:hypothetical protein ID866_6528 [Astraeus odoratus]